MSEIIIFILISTGTLVYLFLATELLRRIWKTWILWHNYYICGSGCGPGSCSGCGVSINNDYYNSIRLKRNPDDDIIGKGFHRSGWPKVIQKLDIFNDYDGILLDDFVEQTFCYNENPPVYTKDWIGIFHHPDDIPYFGNSKEKLQVLFKNEKFIESVKKLKLAVALSEKLGNFLKENLSCKVVVLKHPIELNKFGEWSLKEWLENDNKKLIQIGFYQRNTQLYNQIPKIDNIDIKRVWINKNWLNDWDNKVKNYFKYRKLYNNGTDLKFQTPSKFDKLLTNNVMMTEYVSVSASNVILDCISRNCPLFVNPKPEVIEYLGKDYPLYFDNPEEIKDLIVKIPEANEYLKNLNKDKFSLEIFCDDLINEVKKIEK